MSPDFRAFVEDQLGRIVKLRSRAMFGGVGLYADDLFFALLDDDVLYLKVDEATRPRYEARGLTPFQPEGMPAMAYYRAPAEALEDVGELRGWALEAVGVARRAKGAKVTKSGKSGASRSRRPRR